VSGTIHSVFLRKREGKDEEERMILLQELRLFENYFLFQTIKLGKDGEEIKKR
jgi:hypothetical protein